MHGSVISSERKYMAFFLEIKMSDANDFQAEVTVAFLISLRVSEAGGFAKYQEPSTP